MNSRIRIDLLVTVLAAASVLVGCSRSKPVEEIRVSDSTQVDALPPPAVAPADWPWWRGPMRDNVAVGDLPSFDWTPSPEVLWTVSVPGTGHASPVVWQDRVFIATADDRQQTQSLICYERGSGKPKWNREIHSGGFMHTHSKNTHASATPACDGSRVFTVFMVQNGLFATAVDFEGNIVWQKKVGDFRSQHGYGSSPLIHKSLVIVAGDTSAGGFLTALHRESGDIVWQTPRGDGNSYATPVIGDVAGKQQLLLSGQNATAAYDPDTGRQLWSAAGPANTTANTVAWSSDLILSSGGYPQKSLIAVQADGTGKIAWEHSLKAYVPSPLVVGEKLVVITDNGILHCMNLDDGKILTKERLGGDFTSSPVFVGDKVLACNESGKVFVFKVEPKFETVAQHQFDDGIFASPAVCGGQIFIRTASKLCCIGSADRSAADRMAD